MAIKRAIPAEEVARRVNTSKVLKGLRKDINDSVTIDELRACVLKLYKAVNGEN